MSSIDTVMSKYSVISDTLETLSQPRYDSETITVSTGLQARLYDFRVILCMHILKMVHDITGPASRQLLQSVAIDLGSATALLSKCKRKFDECRVDADSL